MASPNPADLKTDLKADKGEDQHFDRSSKCVELSFVLLAES